MSGDFHQTLVNIDYNLDYACSHIIKLLTWKAH